MARRVRGEGGERRVGGVQRVAQALRQAAGAPCRRSPSAGPRARRCASTTAPASSSCPPSRKTRHPRPLPASGGGPPPGASNQRSAPRLRAPPPAARPARPAPGWRRGRASRLLLERQGDPQVLLEEAALLRQGPGAQHLPQGVGGGGGDVLRPALSREGRTLQRPPPLIRIFRPPSRVRSRSRRGVRRGRRRGPPSCPPPRRRRRRWGDPSGSALHALPWGEGDPALPGGRGRVPHRTRRAIRPGG